jgi:hypothetical protein
MSRDRLDCLAVNGDAVVFRVDQKPSRRRGLAVDADRSRRDELVGGTAAGHAGSCQEAIQTFLVSGRALDAAPD